MELTINFSKICQFFEQNLWTVTAPLYFLMAVIIGRAIYRIFDKEPYSPEPLAFFAAIIWPVIIALSVIVYVINCFLFLLTCKNSKE